MSVSYHNWLFRLWRRSGGIHWKDARSELDNCSWQTAFDQKLNDGIVSKKSRRKFEMLAWLMPRRQININQGWRRGNRRLLLRGHHSIELRHLHWDSRPRTLRTSSRAHVLANVRDGLAGNISLFTQNQVSLQSRLSTTVRLHQSRRSSLLPPLKGIRALV